jgi:hypothetical protein
MPRADRRRSVRYAVRRCTALFRRRRLLLFFEKEPHHAPVVDLSSHGIAFLTKRTLFPGDVIRVSFDLPFEVYAVPLGFHLKARVEWLTPAGEPGLKRIGCRFYRIRPDEVELITRIIRYGILRER